MMHAPGAAVTPRVAENDAAIVVELPQIRRPDGVITAYAALPKSIRGNTPGIVVAMHAWGVDAHIRDVVRRAAKAGFMCIAPDLYSRLKAPSGDGSADAAAFAPFASKLQRKQYGGDLRAAGLHLLSKAPNCKLGIMGFGIGGELALMQALDNSDVFDAAAPFEGALKNVPATDLHIPICGSYGEKDPDLPGEEVRTWRGSLRVPNDLRVYASAAHAFFDDTRTSYVASAADDAWKRTLGFFKDQLGLQT